MLTLPNYKMQNSCLFAVVNIYMLLHIYILPSSWLCSGLPSTLCHLAQLRPSVAWGSLWALLLQLQRELSLDGLSTGAQEPQKHPKSSTSSCLHSWLGGQQGLIGEQPRGLRYLKSPKWKQGQKQKTKNNKTKQNRKPTAIRSYGRILLKSSFYRSYLIFFNKSVLLKRLLIVKNFPRAKCTVDSLSDSVLK